MARDKSPSITPMRIPVHGRGKLRIGGTNKGGPGRPPDEFKALCQQLATNGAVVAAVVLRDKDHPAYLGALKWATEHGYGKPKETIDLQHSGKVAVTFARESRKRTAG